MEDQHSLPNSITSQKQQATSSTVKKDSSVTGFFGKSGYKFWGFTTILLLAFWSMFTGSVSLKWSSGSLTTFSDDFHSPVRDNLDVLELEEREKVVRKMWYVYTHSASVRVLFLRLLNYLCTPSFLIRPPFIQRNRFSHAEHRCIEKNFQQKGDSWYQGCLITGILSPN